MSEVVWKSIRNIKSNDLFRKYFDTGINKTYTLSEFLNNYTRECDNSIVIIIQSKSMVGLNY